MCGASIGSPLAFVRGEARAESNRRCVEHQLGALLFFVRGATVKKHKFLLSKGPPIRSRLLFVCGATHVKNLNFW
jgi:hypothetical protein